MPDTPRFDLIDVVRTLRRRIGFILIFTVVAAAVGAAAYFLQEKQYKATSEFFVSNPNYTDRSNLFRTDQAQFINYFGTEDDIDKVMAISNSEVLKARVIQNTGLAAIYKLDMKNAADANRLFALFKKHYDAKRTEYQNMEVSYTDADPKVAAYVTNEAVKEIEHMYSGYYGTLRDHVSATLTAKIAETDSELIATSAAAEAATSNVDRMKLNAALEQLIKDRSKYLSLQGEFSTGTKLGELPLINVITQAAPPTTPKGLGAPLTILAAALVGAAFAALWVLLAGYYRALMAVHRD